MIEGTLRNVKQCIKNRESATKEIEKQELAVTTMVLETRTKTNGQLDMLDEKLLHELKSTSHTCKSKYMKILQKLESTEEMLTKVMEQTIHMKQFSSDIQVFLGTRQANKQIVREVESIKREIESTKNYELKVSIHRLIEKLSNEVEDFGKIMVSESATDLDFRDPKIDQAQIGINVPKSGNISNIKLQLIKSFQITRTHKLNVAGCVILPNGHFFMANYTKDKHLIECSETGEHIRDILVSGKTYDIAVVDLNCICVSYGDTKFLEIMNRITFHFEKKISLQKCCLGVSHENGRLYVVYGNHIKVMDLSGQQLETFITASENVLCIKTRSDKMFYADYKTGKVHCCQLNEEELWQFECDSINFPYSVTVDNYYNVYVVGYVSDNLTIIQHDGKDSKTLLTKSDGLLNPQAVYYDEDKKALLVCSKEGKVALYKVS
ncbi:unnamed protein product [Mytilus coruscus]|uniref:TRIM2_3 n=1 Tax=Mytilus coruscus TaxID=42192 RepID=A0A6J8DIB5_MYTCO|nr:unnamed protein product [Mytilus coruscus]